MTPTRRPAAAQAVASSRRAGGLAARALRPALCLLAACVLALAARPLAAEPNKSPPAAEKTAKRKAKKASAPKLDAKTRAQLESASTLLRSAEREDIEAGIQALGLLGIPAAVDPLVARVREGLPPDLLETALVTLMALGQPSASPLLYDLAQHRRAEIRVRAIEAIAAVRPPDAQATLVDALSDGNPEVRAAAANALGEIGASGALESLFLALDHGNMNASLAIGKAVPSREASRLASYLGKVPFHSLGPALGEVLKRNDVNESDKLSLVARLEEVGTSEVKSFFNDLMAATSGTLSPNVSRAILRAIQEIADR